LTRFEHSPEARSTQGENYVAFPDFWEEAETKRQQFFDVGISQLCYEAYVKQFEASTSG